MIKDHFSVLQNLHSVDFLFHVQETGGTLKVSKNQKYFMKTLFLPKTNEIILRISALFYKTM